MLKAALVFQLLESTVLSSISLVFKRQPAPIHLGVLELTVRGIGVEGGWRGASRGHNSPDIGLQPEKGGDAQPGTPLFYFIFQVELVLETIASFSFFYQCE